MPKKDLRIQAASAIGRRAMSKPPARPMRRMRRRDQLPAEAPAPVWQVAWRCAEVYMALLGGAIFGVLAVGPLLALLFYLVLDLVLPSNYYFEGLPAVGLLLGFYLGVLGTPIGCALLVAHHGQGQE
jgi:hypothetical protein